MCGIAGYHGVGVVDADRLERCLSRMRHRGPDHHQLWTTERDGMSSTLLHSRLSIIDLDPRSHQPMSRGPLTVAFNGEIYNYREIRRDLEANGVRFTTSSDTEVLIAALHHHGWDALDRFEGMWAFALFDERTGRLSLARDRFAEKPLVTYRTDQGVYFGSEVAFLSALSGRGFTPNLEHLTRYLVNGYKALYKTDETFFEEVTEVPAGLVMQIDRDGTISAERSWSPRLEIDDGMSFDEAVEGTREHLRRSVEIRMRADVPLAFSLSGGVDSVALTSIAKRELGAEVHGFTIINTDPRYEEREIVEHVVDQLGISHSPIKLDTRDSWSTLHELVRHRSSPILTITYYVQWLLMRAVKDAGYKVVVGGTGADELFSGYFDHHLLYMASVDEQRRVSAAHEWSSHVRPYVRNPYLQDPARFVEDPGFRDHIYLDADRFASLLTQPWHEPFAERSYHHHPLRNRMLNELFHESVPVIMHEEDLNAMHHSIENRSPYLDRGLMEFASSIPTRHLIRNGRAKAVLREAVRGVAPDLVLDNPRKVGFNAPISALVDFGSPAVRREILADSPVFDLIQRDAVAKMIETREHANSESKFLFNFLNTKLFLDEFA